jgi:hypothetical protein
MDNKRTMPQSSEELQNAYLKELVKDAYKVYMRLKGMNEQTVQQIVNTLEGAQNKLEGKKRL